MALRRARAARLPELRAARSDVLDRPPARARRRGLAPRGLTGTGGRRPGRGHARPATLGLSVATPESEAGRMAKADLPSWVEPELATLTRDRFSDPDWVYERKLDGERCLAFCGPDGVRLMSRNKRDITSTFPEVAGALAAHREDAGRGLVLDGEMVAFDGTQTRFER